MAEPLSRSLLPRLSWTASAIRPTVTAALPASQRLPSSAQRTTATTAFARNAWASRRNNSIARLPSSSPLLNATTLHRTFSASAARSKEHHFDTLKFVQRLEQSGFTREQSTSIMRVLASVIEESIQNLTRTMVLREDQEKATYTQKVDFAKLRSELLSADSSETSLTRASHERLTNDLAKLNNRLRDEVQRTQASVRLDLNLEKGRIREEANSQELKIREVETRIEQESAALRERLEAVKFSTLQWLMGVCTGTAAIILEHFSHAYRHRLHNVAPTVTIDQGTYVGKVLESANHPVPIEAFLGVRYVQLPVGKLRFARPVPLRPNEEKYQATEWGFRSPSQQFVTVEGAPNLEPNEDCLTANIFRWQGTTDKAALPIMVYIHGGAYNRGTASMHDTASMLSHSADPFLAISFNYRLGSLGFLNSSYTAEKGLLNLGLHDQILLLEWVQANASAFGGDPNTVTLVGLSAGAHSIGHHILNINEKRQLFHRAVIESGAATSRATHRPDSELHETQFKKLLAVLGLSPDAPDLLAELRSAPVDNIVEAQNAVFGEYNPSVRRAWQPVIDNDIISRIPLEGWQSGEYHDVPILTGFNHNEGAGYVPRMLSTSNEFRAFFEELLPQLSEEQLSKLEELYLDPETHPEAADKRDLTALEIGKQYARVEKAYGHYAYVNPVRQTARYNKNKTWLYHWALKGDEVFGANHADQMWYAMMAPSKRGISEAHEAIAKAFNGAVTRFVVHGDLGSDWRAFGEEGETMVFGQGNDEAIGGKESGIVRELKVDGWGEEECRFWAEVKELGDL